MEDAPDTVKTIDFRRPSLELLVPELFVPKFGIQLDSCWFASPDTWVLDKAPPELFSNPSRFSSGDLDRVLKTVLRWLVQWIDEGSNPFIHRQLYRHRLPQCIQEAYLLLSSYYHRTASNEQFVFRMIEDRVMNLVAQGVPISDLTQGGAIDDPTALDTLEHLARVQSLLVYQCIGLYDGNIRLRHLAEQHIPILEEWLCQLLSQAGPTTCCGESLVVPPSERIANFTSIPYENILWYSWILAESIRRTWLVAAGIQGIYKLIQHRSAACMGGTIFTSRQGFWEAPSAVAWEKQCSEVYAGLVWLTETDKMFAMVPRGEINEFAKLVLECTYGVEQMERWGI